MAQSLTLRTQTPIHQFFPEEEKCYLAAQPDCFAFDYSTKAYSKNVKQLYRSAEAAASKFPAKEDCLLPQPVALFLDPALKQGSHTFYNPETKEQNPLTPSFRESTDLIPEFREKLNLLKQKLKGMGLEIKVVASIRSRAEQDELYAKGRTARGRVVTGRPGGYDWHEYGVAADVVPIKHRRLYWAAPISTWKKIAGVARSVGLVMGADIPPPNDAEIPAELRSNKRTPSIGHDYPHVQLAGLPQYPISERQTSPQILQIVRRPEDPYDLTTKYHHSVLSRSFRQFIK